MYKRQTLNVAAGATLNFTNPGAQVTLGAVHNNGVIEAFDDRASSGALVDLVFGGALTGVGVAEFIVMNIDLPRFVVRVSDSIECQGKESEKHNSQWIRGHLSGAASGALGVPMECKETRCVSVGDPYCEFELSKSQGSKEL